MKVIGYTRISTDKQDLAKQKHLLLEYAQVQQLLVREFIQIEISSQKDTKARRIDELQAKLQPGDLLSAGRRSLLPVEGFERGGFRQGVSRCQPHSTRARDL
jgi:DNA invertase Pin-like site-specific DNA recombinase